MATRPHAYTVALERTEQSSNQDILRTPTPQQTKKNIRSGTGKRYVTHGTTRSPSTPSAEALVASSENKTPAKTPERYYDTCRYCEKRHWSDECQIYKTIEERKQKLRGSCYKCLKRNHIASDCKRGTVCVHCGAENLHHRSLCPKKFPVKANTESVQLVDEIGESSGTNKNNDNREEQVLISSGESVLMQTAKAEVTNPYESGGQQVRLLLDCGSQRTYITEKLAAKLNLEKEDETEIKLVTFGSKNTKTIRTPSTHLNIKLNDGNVLRISANIVPNITGTIHRQPFAPSENQRYLLKGLELADTVPNECESTTVELLIGNDYYLDLVLPQKIEVQSGLYLLSSKLGWLLTGRMGQPDCQDTDTSMLVLTYGKNLSETNVFTASDESMRIKPDIEDFWKIESIGITDDPEENDEKVAMDNFTETLRVENNRYYVTWPWKTKNPDLPLNRELAMGRLRSCVSKLKNTPELMMKYNSVIQDQLNKGVIEKADSNVEDGIKHYLPHHAVITPTKETTKIRVVYDASSKSRIGQSSLNDCLYRGPIMLHDLCGILMRFRLHEIAMIADIEKLFLQVGLQQDQREAMRFFWIKDNNDAKLSDDNIQEYLFCRVPFGVISSPFLLGATIDHHLNSYKTTNSEKLKRNIYVDNVVTGTHTVEDAKSLYSEAKELFSQASMNLREWVSNNDDVNYSIPCEDRADRETMKVLGYTWNIKADTLSVVSSTLLNDDMLKMTKRNVLKQLASVYDPLGMVAPVILLGKILLQRMWSKHLDWDDELDTETAEIWPTVKPDLQQVSECNFPRSVAVKSDKKNVLFAGMFL